MYIMVMHAARYMLLALALLVDSLLLSGVSRICMDIVAYVCIAQIPGDEGDA